jgi:hypothetical protein
MRCHYTPEWRAESGFYVKIGMQSAAFKGLHRPQQTPYLIRKGRQDWGPESTCRLNEDKTE